MKTGISVDDALLEQADTAARRMGLSRSRLFSVAMEAYLRQREGEEITAKLDEIYAKDGGEAERGMAARLKAKTRATIEDKW